jgi:probable F420-dependent oxidoreductase
MGDSLPAVGVHPTATDRSIPILELASEAEARGLRSISLPEHTHAPVDTSVLVEGWPVLERYQRTLDPYVASSFIAATTDLEVGTAVSLVAQHDAIALAKALATLDYLAEGRVILGVGFGYNRHEAEDHGFAARDRFGIVEETIALMRALWTEEVAEYQGQHRRLSPSRAWPKPARAGGPPVLLGGRATEENLKRIVGWADGWIPAGLGVTDPAFGPLLAELRSRWEGGGRPGQPEICCFFPPGTKEEMAVHLEGAARLGVQRMQVFLEDRPRDLALPVLDEVAAAIELAAEGSR